MSSKNKKKKTPAVRQNNKKQEEKKKSAYSLSQKLFPAILISLAAPLTLCVFGPFDIYYGNMQEFLFSLGDFLPLCLLACLLLAVMNFVVLILLDGKAFDIGCVALASVSLMLFIQRNYMNMGVNALVGDGVGTSGVGVGMHILNALIWLVVLAGSIFAVVYLRKKHLETVMTVVTIAMIALIGMQLVSFGVTSLTSDVYVPVTERMEDADDTTASGDAKVLTFKNFSKLSDKKNVVFFLVDRFDAKYYDKMVKSDPTFFDRLDGFTYYNDYLSLYCRTYPSVTSILTGVENDFSDTRLNYFKDAYADGGHLRTLSEKGYGVNVYTKKFYAYDDAAVMSDYVDNTSGVKGYYIDDYLYLAGDMLRLSLSEYLPFCMKGVTGYMSTPDFNAHAVYETEAKAYSSDLLDVYSYLQDSTFSTVSGENRFFFIHLDGCHTPNKYGATWEEATDKEKYDTNLALKQNFDIIYQYIDQMKALGVYEDATIIITGDHPAAVSDTLLIGETGSSSDTGTRVTAMLFKKSGDAGTALTTSTAQISQDELWATILESEGIGSDELSFFDVKEGEDRERRYLFEQSAKKEKNGLDSDRIVEYKITGSGNDPANWKVFKETDIGKIYK